MQYEIVGAPFPAVVCTLQRGEQMKTEKGSMVWMDPCMTMPLAGVADVIAAHMPTTN